MLLAAVFLFLIVLFILLATWQTQQRAHRLQAIKTFVLPPGVLTKLQAKRPELTLSDCALVQQALQQFFRIYLKGDFKFIAMPSQVVDDLWHEFILYTHHYNAFCKSAFGRFLHHSPAAALPHKNTAVAGLHRCWQLACEDEKINPKHSHRLPLLFAIDAQLNIQDGFRYLPDALSVKHDQQNNSGCGACGGGTTSHSCNAGAEAGDGGCGGGCGGD